MYVDPGEFVVYVGSERVGDAAFLDDCLTTAERVIREDCCRDFTPVDAAASPTTRTYAARRDGRVIIHDLASTVGVVVTDNGSTVSTGALWFDPVGGMSESGEARPYDTIRRVSGSWSTAAGAVVTVTSDQWGWPGTTVHPSVKQATMILAKDIVDLRANKFGVAGFDGTGVVVRVRDNHHVAMLLDGLHGPKRYGIA